MDATTTTTRHPGIDGYTPTGIFREAWGCREFLQLFSGPAGTGKSLFVLNWLLACCLTWSNVRALIVRKTRSSLSQSILTTFEKKVLPPGHPALKGADRRYRESYKLSNGSEIVVAGLDDRDCDRVLSAEYDLAYVAEAREVSEEAVNTVISRMRNGAMPFVQVMMDTNPSHPQHWLLEKANAGELKHWVTKHEDNPVYYDEATGTLTEEGDRYINGVLERMTGMEYQRLRLGKWVGAEGMVYPDFDPSLHIIEPFDVPRSWRKFRSIDFGYTNAFVCLWLALDEDDRLFVYRQLYQSELLVEDAAREIQRLDDGEGIPLTVADHDAEDRATLHRHGILTVAADKDVQTGIQSVASRLRVAGDGKPRLFIMRDSLVKPDSKLQTKRSPTCIEQEFPLYVWHEEKTDKENKELPVKANDHALDALRYGCKRADSGTVPHPQIGRRDDTIRLRSVPLDWGGPMTGYFPD